jgi:hypothetical protein
MDLKDIDVRRVKILDYFEDYKPKIGSRVENILK